MHEDTDAIRRRLRSPRNVKKARPLTRFENWAWGQITLFRIALVGVYAGLIYFAIAAFIGGVPAFVETAPRGYTFIWAVGMGVGAAIALVGSVSDSRRSHRIEAAGTILLWIAASTYTVVLHVIAYGFQDPGRQAIAAASLVLTILPGCRMLWLLMQFGKRRS